MTTNEQRAFKCWADSDPVAAITAALDAAEARGRAGALGEALGIAATRGPLDAVAWMSRRHAVSGTAS